MFNEKLTDPPAPDAPQPDVGGNTEAVSDSSSATSTGQATLADFKILGETGALQPSGAAFPDLPQPSPEKRGRGRPRKDGSSTTKKSANVKSLSPGELTDLELLGAEGAVSVLDLCLSIASENNHAPNMELRAAYIKSVAKYIRQRGGEIPVWAELSLLTVAYTLPTVMQPTFTQRVGIAFSGVVGWFKKIGTWIKG